MPYTTCLQLVKQSFLDSQRESFRESNHGKWCNATEHMRAWNLPNATERAIKLMILGLAERCDAYAKGNPDEHGYLGECGYWGEYATDYVKALIALLNLDTGRLDCGACERLIRAIAANARIELEE